MSTIQLFPPPNESPITDAILWQYANTQVLSTLIKDKAAWYERWSEMFWTDWVRDVFNLVTANEFGLSVWSIILNVPLFVNLINPIDDTQIFGFNEYDPPGVPPTLINTYLNFSGSNFSRSADSIILTVEQQRFLLRLKYLKLISRGSVPQTNFNLNWLMLDSVARGLAPASSEVSNPVTVTGTTTTGSPIITALSSTAGLFVGMGVNGTGIADNSNVASIGSDTVTLTQNATADGTVSLDFGSPTAWVLEDFGMQITYQFNFYLASSLQRAIRSTEVFPNPAGVKVLMQFWNGSDYINF